MKLIKKWRDTVCDVENFLYKNDLGLKVVHTLNKNSKDTVIDVVVKSGTYFEKMTNTPNGTAHFLEHMLCKPNHIFKTQKAIDNFENGTIKTPKLITNASTTFKFQFFYGFCNSQGEDKLMKRILSMVCYPTRLFQKHIEKERKIIISELQNKKKPINDSYLQHTKFSLQNGFYTNTFSLIGETEENIKKISTKDLIKYYNSCFNIPNIIITIQSPKKISQMMQKYIDKIALHFHKNENNITRIKPEKLYNECKIQVFHDSQLQGSTLYFDYFRKIVPSNITYPYKEYLLSVFSLGLLRYVCSDILREKKGYIYGIGTSTINHLTWYNSVESVDLTLKVNLVTAAIDMFYEVIKNKANRFLDSKNGKRWFEGKISTFIYLNTEPYDKDYAEELGIRQLINKGVYDFEKAKKIGMKIKIGDLKDFFSERFVDIPPRIWVESPEDEKTILKEINNSKLVKRWKD
ncbi:insulinase family protein [Candidatus Dojkabacteria bacterium]|nr:insulinase family protein [Candidatus Dojkabacteria bacterium]